MATITHNKTLKRSSCFWATGPNASHVDWPSLEQAVTNKKRAAIRPKRTVRFFRILRRPEGRLEFEVDCMGRDPFRQSGDGPILQLHGVLISLAISPFSCRYLG